MIAPLRTAPQRVEGLQRAGHTIGVGRQAHRAAQVTVDVSQHIGAASLGAEGHAIVIGDRRAVGAVFSGLILLSDSVLLYSRLITNKFF